MGNEQHEVNRSSALTPEQLAVMNETTRTAVQEAVKVSVSAILAAFAPQFEKMALTPDKLREAMRPYEDPAKAARDLRESLKWKEDDEETRKLAEARKQNCLHLDKNGRPAVCLVHNQPDRQARGICVLCSDWIHPKEWRIGPPDAKNPRGKAYLVQPHKDYRMVLQIEAMQ